MSQPQYSPEHRAVAYFFKLLGKPAEFEPKFKDWLLLMRDAMGEVQITDVGEMKRFLQWAVVDHAYSRKYLLVAKDPMVTLRKNVGQLVRRWRAENPAIDPDPLWKDVKIPGFDGDKPIVQKHVRRKPKTAAERRELLALPLTRWGINPNTVKWLAQDKCPKCGGKGHHTEKVYPDSKRRRWQERMVQCECVHMEELL
jgi:hypothetical protein